MTAAHTSTTSTKQDFSESCSAEHFWIPYHKMVSILKWLFYTSRFWVICLTAIILEQWDGGWGAVCCSRIYCCCFSLSVEPQVSGNKKLKPKNLNLLHNKDNLNYTKSVYLYTCVHIFVCIYLIWNRIDIADIELLTQTFSLKWLQWTWTKMQKL